MRKIRNVLGAMAIISTAALGQDAARVYAIGHPSARGMQEIATVLRTVLDARTLHVDTAAASITLEGSPVLLATADWLMPLLDGRPADGPNPVRYTAPNGNDDVIEVYYFNNIQTPRGVQEALTQLRTVVQLQKIFNVTEARAIAFRGSSADLAMSEWLVKQLDIAPGTQGAGVHEYAAPAGEVMRVFYLEPAVAPERMGEILKDVRTKAGIMYAFNFSSPEAIAVRGTPEQVAEAEGIIGGR